MDELMWITDSHGNRYEYYEDLLCKREEYYREANSRLLSFNKEFGLKIKDNFALKIECVKVKKQIAYCQKQVNRGKTINLDLMRTTVEEDMLIYYTELKEILDQYLAGKNSVTVESGRIRRAKAVYRRLTRRLHPDINKRTMEEPQLRELWNRIMIAYHYSDVEELEDLEVLAGRILADIEGTAFEYAFMDVEEKIRRVERQIREILSSEPYIYDDLLSSDIKKAKKHEELDLEHSEYEEYLHKLKLEFENLMGKGGVSFTWQMN